MINNDKFGALSMYDKALLINKYVSGGVMDLKEMRRHYNSFGDGGDTNGEEKTSFWKRLLESGQSARDARVGAVGAQQVRDLYSEGKNEEAQKLAQQYAKANTTGISLASGAATSSLLGDLAVTGATTTVDTLIGGDVNDFGKNFLYNAVADIVGHGTGKAVDKVAKTIKATKLAKALNSTKLEDANLAHGIGVESKIIPVEVKNTALQDAISFENALAGLNRTEQIKRFNTFAKKYGYEEIGEGVSDEVLDKATKEMLERHNTFFRGVRPSEEVTNLATKLGISEEEALKIAATTPRAGETHVFVSPTSNAGIYGGGEYVAQVRRPYELGNDRTQWFNEANFEITPGMYSKGNEDVIDPWFSSTVGTTEIPNELLMKKGEFVDWVKGPLDGKGSNNKIFRKYNKTLEIYEPEDLVKFANGGRILEGTETEQTLSGKKPTLEEFLQAKADSTRNAALEKSYNRKTGILIPYELSPARRKLNEDNVVTMREYADTSFVGPSLPIKEEKKKITGNLLRTYQRHYYKALKELEDNCEYGLNCIGTATDNYPQDSHTDNNNDFRENHNNYGFILIDESKAEPGDIVQSGAHGMIYASNIDGERLFNWSSGGPTEFDYVTNGHFGLGGLDYYRYVGTPKLIQQWTEEYNTNHSKKYGGKLNKFATGGPKGAGQDTYNHPKYNHAEEAEMYSYLRSRGVPHVQASAIMGNIAVESMLNPEITQIGGGGGYGLIQATDRSRKKAFINYDGQPYEFGYNISPETQRQLDYIIDKGLNTQTKGEWRGNHNIGRASVARRKFLEATDVNKASTIFTENYLRPGKPHTKRRKSMSNYFNDNYGITERALEEFENSFLFQNN